MDSGEGVTVVSTPHKLIRRVVDTGDPIALRAKITSPMLKTLYLK